MKERARPCVSARHNITLTCGDGATAMGSQHGKLPFLWTKIRIAAEHTSSSSKTCFVSVVSRGKTMHGMLDNLR